MPWSALQVIAALRDGRTPEPEHYANVTIIFCDIVDFADLSVMLEPQQVRLVRPDVLSAMTCCITLAGHALASIPT